MPLNLTNTPYSANPVDLTEIKWDYTTHRSTAGLVPKAYCNGHYYKLSSFNPSCGFYGNEALVECAVSDILDTMRIPHIKYKLQMADIIYKGAHFTTAVCISEDFNKQKKPTVSIDRFLAAQCPGRDSLTACIQLGFSDYIYQMFLVDFVVLNRDRHGSNIEIIDGAPRAPVRPWPFADGFTGPSCVESLVR